jgi:hypothetical protein
MVSQLVYGQKSLFSLADGFENVLIKIEKSGIDYIPTIDN